MDMETKKKIKMVTFTPQANFGTCLQSYALNTILRKMGHDVEFIYNGSEYPAYGIKGTIKDILKNNLPSFIVEGIRRRERKQRAAKAQSAPSLGNATYTAPPTIVPLRDSKWRYLVSKMPLYEPIYKLLKYRNRQWRKVYKFAFKDNNYNMRRLYTAKHYNDVVKDADVFITGSDQIWNPYCCGFNPMLFIEFVNGKKCISYSSSIARPSFPKEVEERAKKDLQKFTHIAVRESSSVDLLRKLLHRDDIHLVVDPTYLLSKEEWTAFGERAHIEFKIPERYIFCYFIGFRREDYAAMVEDVKEKTGIKDVITVDCTNNKINYGNGILYKDGGPYEFVYLLSHASFVCMDSFHATVFALKFKVDFVHILKDAGDGSESSQNLRMYDLFARYNILYKLYDKNSSEWLAPINWDEVDQIIQEEVEHSMNYLVNAINN